MAEEPITPEKLKQVADVLEDIVELYKNPAVKADALFAEGKYEEAAKAYRDILLSSKDSSRKSIDDSVSADSAGTQVMNEEHAKIILKEAREGVYTLIGCTAIMAAGGILLGYSGVASAQSVALWSVGISLYAGIIAGCFYHDLKNKIKSCVRQGSQQPENFD
jgi:hypothetical protein